MGILNALLVTSILTLTVGLAWSHEDLHRIVGGYEVKNIEDIPWQVSVQHKGSHFCGGSIISEKWILCAAHCFGTPETQGLTIRAGSRKHTRGGTVIQLQRIIKNANWSESTIDFDYSLLELSKPLKFSKKIQPIILPNENENVADGADCLVSGWGLTKDDKISRINLRAAKVPIVNQEKCVEAYKTVTPVTPRMLCAGYDEGGISTCQQDSGGPLVCNNKQFGIVSWGQGCALPKFPGVYSRVTTIRQWIRENSGI